MFEINTSRIVDSFLGPSSSPGRGPHEYERPTSRQGEITSDGDAISNMKGQRAFTIVIKLGGCSLIK